MMLYIARSGGAFRERAFSTLLRLSRKPPPSIRVDGGGRLKRIVHEQFLVLFFDEARAVRTLPALRPDDGTHRAGVVELIRDGVGLVGGLPLATVTERFWMVEEMFDPPGAEPVRRKRPEQGRGRQRIGGEKRRMSRVEGRAAAWPVLVAAGAAMLLGSAAIASAQEIEPNDFLPAPDGTSINLNYFAFGHAGAFINPNGTNIPNSSANAFIGVERFAHFAYVSDHPVGFQVAQAFGSISNPTVNGMNLGTATGASDVNFAAFFWPYANFERKEYLVFGAYVYPPTGSYNKNQSVNFADFYQPNGQYNWTGDLQIGWEQGVGDRFSYDVGFDARFFGETTGPIQPGSGIPLSVTTHHKPDYRVQLWLNWQWNPALRTAVGYEGWFGGLDYFSTPRADTVNTGKSFEQRLRGAVTMFWSPRIQTILEVNGDVARTGGFKQTIGATLRFAYFF